MKNQSHNSWGSGRDLKEASPEYQPTTLPLHELAWHTHAIQRAKNNLKVGFQSQQLMINKICASHN